MNKKFKNLISLLLVLINILCPLLVDSKIVNANPLPTDFNAVHIILDEEHYTEMPRSFRKTSDLSIIQDNKTLNLNGLDKLNISGSHQFSENNLPLLVEKIGTKLPITVVDLRQESHGFANGLPLSFANEKNDANINLTRGQVIAKENIDLASIKLNEPLTFFNYPNITITPTKVENEETLTKSKSLAYIRIPVTDDKMPTDDMVDYFIQLIKNEPKDNWLHFHCKHGVGRTTTFMIMYDMMKNYKTVSADDIIKRQLFLANLKDSDIKPFYDKDALTFLQNFYKYCKENGDNLNVKWSDWKKTTATTISSSFSSIFKNKTNSNYIKNAKKATYLYVISQDTMSPSERTMIATLQGQVNSKSSSQIYTLNSSQPDYKIWLDDLSTNYKIQYKNVSNPWDLLDIFKDKIAGYILYSNKTSKDPSINNACSFASLKNSIAIDESIENKVRAHGITTINADCRNTDKAWAYNNLWNAGLNHSLVIQLSPNKDTSLRDYSILSKALIFYEDDINDISLRDKIFSSMEKDSTCLGWGPDEFTNVSTTSKYGVSMVAADWSYNLTILSAFPLSLMHQKSKLNIPTKENVHYITFIISDGDNQQWLLGSNYTSPKWYGSPDRGNFNLGWSLSPSLYYLAPTVFNLYYKSASTGLNNDYFIVSPSGNGYIYPSRFDKNSLNTYVNTLNNYMKKVDQKYVAIIDDNSFYNTKLWDKFTAKSNIEGLFYLDYHKHNNFHGEITWSNNKPIVSCRDLLWKNIESEDELAKNINDRINYNQVNINNPSSYTFVYVHAWSKDLNNVQNAINKLKQNPKVEIVTPEVFMKLIKNNVKH
ncbi:Inositol hexakisphosphate [Clostridium cavendishii DSM 21758]|uniref:Inositol hexakisphosphate n=1 Tax=Clostridium cavendishii DSM 21758 TaxID=1121302 RepID=A0A1M6FAL8_9CLOT|nr:GxGYxYP domain-containing protein [Clostridium cavendishii]SHI94794.1 Inositol hexakisphosphate [Clostridium cavendishii DSM 21758]